jgi:hypothetical protein
MRVGSPHRMNDSEVAMALGRGRLERAAIRGRKQGQRSATSDQQSAISHQQPGTVTSDQGQQTAAGPVISVRTRTREWSLSPVGAADPWWLFADRRR